MTENTWEPAILKQLEEMTAFRLANEIDLACPDADDSPGAAWLRGVRDAVVEALRQSFADEAGTDELDDRLHEIADSAVEIYTHPRWLVFTDLCLYNEDVDDIVGESSTADMTERAGLAQFTAAYRLAGALLEIYQHDIEALERCEVCGGFNDAGDEPGYVGCGDGRPVVPVCSVACTTEWFD